MRIIVSAATTSDGYMDDRSAERLVLSDEKDWAEVHALRAQCDAILVGAETIRRDNPSLVLRDERLRSQRVAAGKSSDIIKVTISSKGDISADRRFFTEGPEARKTVIVGREATEETVSKLSAAAEVIRLDNITAGSVYEVLSAQGIGSLMVEGGARVIRMFFDEGMVDEFRLAISPFSLRELEKDVADNREAPRLPYFGELPFESYAKRSDRKVGVMSVSHYTINPAPSQEDIRLLQRAIDISEHSTPTDTAYRVGCVLKTADGKYFEGYTHETSPSNHAEEEAILKAEADGSNLRGATIYTSMEPCSKRASKPVSCSELILRNGIDRVVYAYAEPPHFVHCDGTRMLREAGVEVSVVRELGKQVAEINAHIIGCE